jgi:hypothetical protein
MKFMIYKWSFWFNINLLDAEKLDKEFYKLNFWFINWIFDL